MNIMSLCNCTQMNLVCMGGINVAVFPTHLSRAFLTFNCIDSSRYTLIEEQ